MFSFSAHVKDYSHRSHCGIKARLGWLRAKTAHANAFTSNLHKHAMRAVVSTTLSLTLISKWKWGEYILLHEHSDIRPTI